MQLGVISQEAEKIGQDAGLTVGAALPPQARPA
jgi:hypothetical protein